MHCPESMASAQAGPGKAALITDAGDGGALWYAPGGVLTLRPSLAFDQYVIAADGEDAARLELPGPFTVRIDGTDYEVEDTVEITSDMPATYRVEIDHFPYLPLDVEILAE